MCIKIDAPVMNFLDIILERIKYEEREDIVGTNMIYGLEYDRIIVRRFV